MDRPILFSGPMVKAILAGRKSQTRRLLNPQPFLEDGSWKVWWGSALRCWQEGVDPSPIPGWLPFAVGDRFWVRENISIMPRTAYALPKTVAPHDPDMAAYYQADFDRSGKPRWRPSIHMPRWASRLTLTVTDVRVQRVQEISEEDAKAEGTDSTTCANVVDPADGFPSHRSAFGILWDSINARRGFGWAVNPWVMAVSFSVERRNIDAEANDAR